MIIKASWFRSATSRYARIALAIAMLVVGTLAGCVEDEDRELSATELALTSHAEAALESVGEGPDATPATEATVEARRMACDIWRPEDGVACVSCCIRNTCCITCTDTGSYCYEY